MPETSQIHGKANMAEQSDEVNDEVKRMKTNIRNAGINQAFLGRYIS